MSMKISEINSTLRAIIWEAEQGQKAVLQRQPENVLLALVNIEANIETVREMIANPRNDEPEVNVWREK